MKGSLQERNQEKWKYLLCPVLPQRRNYNRKEKWLQLQKEVL